MKTTKWVCGLFTFGLIAFAGCKKAEAPTSLPPATIQMAGVKLDLPKLDTEFQSASPDIQAAVIQIKKSYRGGRFAKMLTELDALSNTPGLTESQKKLVGNLIEQMKQVMSKTPGVPE